MKLLPILSAMILTGISLNSNAADFEQSLDLGATYASGNSDSLLVTLGYTAVRKEASDEYFANLFYTYGEEGDNATNDEILANAAWKHLYSDRFYAGPRLDFRMDSLADIDYRGSFTALAGYFLVKEDHFSLSFEGGLGLTSEKIGGVKSEFLHAYVGQTIEYKISEKTKIYQSLGIFAAADDLGDYQLLGEIGLETSLSDNMSLKIFVQDKYDTNPATGADSNDLRVITGVSYKF